MPLNRRLPKRGFNNVQFAEPCQIVNLRDLERHFDAGATVDAAALQAAGLVTDAKGKVKVLAAGKLSKQLTVKANLFSQQARTLIEQAGGKATLIEQQTAAEKAKAKRGTAKKAGKAAGKAAKPAKSDKESQAAAAPEAAEKPAEE
jgi:large subunit ribosomal protein L15